MATIARYRQCASCKKLMPYIQVRCDCGEKISGAAPVFKVCPGCASVLEDRRLRCDCGYLFIFRRFLDKQNGYESDPEQINLAYERGRHDGIAEEKARSAAELDGFLRDAHLVNPYNKKPILSRSDFAEYKKAFNEDLARLEKRRREAEEEARRQEKLRVTEDTAGREGERPSSNWRREKFCLADG